MSKVQMLRALVKQRLTAAAEEIFGLFERTIAEYEEELSRSKEENERQRKLLDAVFSPQLRLHRADVQQQLVVKEEVPPEQQEWSSCLDQEDPEPPHIKEEQEELWTSQEGEQLQLEEADITKFPFNPVPVKSEDDDEKPQSSQLHLRLTEQMETHPEPDTDDKTGDSSEPETDDGDDWKETREPQLGLNSLSNDEVPVTDSRCGAGAKPCSCSECGKRFGFWRNLKRHMRSHTGEKPFSCLVCGKAFIDSGNLKRHLRIHTGEKPFSCSVCGKICLREADLKSHMVSHTGEKRFSCSVCDQRFTRLYRFTDHQCVGRQFSQLYQRQTKQMETEADGEDCGEPEQARNSDPDTHPEPDSVDMTGDSSEPETDGDHWRETRETQSGLNSPNNDKVPVSDSRCSAGEKPFSCSECGRSFGLKGDLKRHMRSHTGERPFSCSVCKKSFTQSGNLQIHMRIHTGEKPFSCSVCDRAFSQSAHLKRHVQFHKGEKTFCCSLCDKVFIHSGNLKTHMRCHTGEKPFSCSVCKKSFTQSGTLQAHMRSHTGKKPFRASRQQLS